jgi:O-antigen ligase
LFTNWKQNLNKWKIGALSLLIIYFLIFIILLSSKAGMLTLIIIFLLTVSYLIVFEKKYFQGALIFLMVCVLFIGAFKLFPKSLNRIIIAQEALENRNQIEHGASEGTTGRLLIWENSLEIIRNNFLFGVGTGDVKDFLLEKYEENKFTYYQNKEFNAHNQYLQTFISLGLFGFIVLLLTLMLPLAYAIKNKQFIYLFFLIIFSLNLLVESMFETQAGVVFYAFFNSFLLFINKKPRQEET